MNIPLFKVRVSSQAERNLTHVFESGWIGNGPVVSEFEARLMEFIGSPAIATNSCTSALHLAFTEIAKTCDTVITTPLTCFATTAAILHAGLKIKWADVDPETLNIADGQVQKLYEPGDAVCVVHFAGRCCPLPLDLETPIVEDCAHAFGTIGVGMNPNTYGCFSFQAVKTLTCGDGGCLVPPPEKVRHFQRMNWYGMDRRWHRDQNISEAGFKYHMNDVAASIGMANWDYAQDALVRQKGNAYYYSQELADISLPYDEDSANWLYPIMVDDRNGFVERLRQCGIESSPAHYRNDKHDCVEEFRRDLPGMDLVTQRMTCIPNGWWVSPSDREAIVNIIKEGW